MPRCCRFSSSRATTSTMHPAIRMRSGVACSRSLIPRARFRDNPFPNMTRDRLGSLEQHVVHAAEAALAERRFVSPVDVLVGLGWLTQGRVDEWRQGRIDCLEYATTVDPTKLSTAMRVL